MSGDVSRQTLRAPLFKGGKKIVIRKSSTLMPPERRAVRSRMNVSYVGLGSQSHCETALQRMGRAIGWPSLVFRLFGYFAGISGPIIHGNSRQLAPQPILSPIRQTTWRSRV